MAEAAKPRFLRQYALTQGRVRSVGRDWPLDISVQTTSLGAEHGLT